MSLRRYIRQVAVLTAISSVVGCQGNDHRPASAARYDQIEIGMTLGQVEAVLGSGKEIPATQVPLVGNRMEPAVKGTRFYRWINRGDELGAQIIVGFDNDRVCDKWYWEPSL